MKPIAEEGDRVSFYNKADGKRHFGVVLDVTPRRHNLTWYRVRWENGTISTVAEKAIHKQED